MKKTRILLLLSIFAIMLVCVLSSCGTTDSSDVTSGAPEDTTQAEPTFAQIDVTATGGEYKISFSWDAVEGADGYEVYISEDNGETFTMFSDSEYNERVYSDAGWGMSYLFNVKAYKTSDGVKTYIGESGAFEGRSVGVRVNDYAPKDDNMVLFCQQVKTKADGYVMYINGEVYIIDAGLSTDTAVKSYLLSLRQQWLGDLYSQYATDKNAKLSINLVISHFHSDHVGALNQSIVPNTLFDINAAYYPSQNKGGVSESHRSTFLSNIKKYASHANLVTLDFGEHQSIEIRNSDATLDLYAPFIDWGVPIPGDTTKGYLYVTSVSTKQSTRDLLVVNSNSMWAKFTHGETSFLFTGDTYDSANVVSAMMDFYGRENFDVDVVKYLHHGSARFSADFYNVTSPAITIFSCEISALTGSKSTQSATYALRLGSELYLTCDGALTVTSDGKNITTSGIAPRTAVDWK